MAPHDGKNPLDFLNTSTANVHCDSTVHPLCFGTTEFQKYFKKQYYNSISLNK